jgi:hypothetical protein
MPRQHVIQQATSRKHQSVGVVIIIRIIALRSIQQEHLHKVSSSLDTNTRKRKRKPNEKQQQ